VDVTLYIAPNTNQGFYNAFKYAIESGLHVAISCSWGSPEYWNSPSPDANYVIVNDELVSLFSALGDLIENASKNGITVFTSSGDQGASDGLPTPLNADFPASLSFMIGVGATSLSLKNPSNLNYDNNAIEVVWNEINTTGGGYSQHSTGGGYSQYFQPPQYQLGALENTPNGQLSYKGVPDVTATGGKRHGYHVYASLPDDDGQGIEPPTYMQVGGTSLTAPLWAALWATITGGEFVHAGKFIYSSYGTSGFRDITVGNNMFTTSYGVIGYSATPGYDLCSGLGSPNGAKLKEALDLFKQNEKK